MSEECATLKSSTEKGHTTCYACLKHKMEEELGTLWDMKHMISHAYKYMKSVALWKCCKRTCLLNLMKK